MRKAWWALVLLAAVFVMHGLQCLGDGPHPGTDHGAAAAALPLTVPAVSEVFFPTAAEAQHAVPDESSRAGLHSRSAVTASGPHTSSGELWALCLAVLSTALALLTAGLLRVRRIAERFPEGASAQRWASAPEPLRPPDLFSLCVLRN